MRVCCKGERGFTPETARGGRGTRVATGGAWGAPAPATFRWSSMGMKPKILIVDDDVMITQQLFWTLCDEFEVMTANSLSSAIRRATAYEPDVSILDLHLPPTPDTPETGLRILDFFKHHLPDAKVFVASTDTSVEVRRELARLGADDFLQKPLDIERLLSTVRRATLGRRLAVA